MRHPPRTPDHRPREKESGGHEASPQKRPDTEKRIPKKKRKTHPEGALSSLHSGSRDSAPARRDAEETAKQLLVVQVIPEGS